MMINRITLAVAVLANRFFIECYFIQIGNYNKVCQEKGVTTKPDFGHSLSRGMTISGDKAKTKKCWNCNKAGHVAKEC